MNKLLLILSIIILTFMNSCSFLVNKFAFFPDRTNNIPTDQLPASVEEVFIETGDREKLQSYLIKNDSTDKVLLYFHGNAGNLGGRLFDLLKLNNIGLTVLGISYRGYGKSSGKPDEKGIYKDGAAAYDYATKTLGYRSIDIVVLGRSIGSTVATAVAEEKDIACLMLVTPMTNGKEYAKYHGLGFISFLAGNAFNNSERIKQIHSPTLIVHGDKDRTVPLFMGKSLYEIAPAKNKKMVTIPGAEHNDLSTAFEEEYWKAIKDFLSGLKPSFTDSLTTK